MANAIAAAAPQPPNFSAYEINRINQTIQALQNSDMNLYIQQATIILGEESDIPTARLEIFNDGEEWVVIPLTNNLPEN